MHIKITKFKFLFIFLILHKFSVFAACNDNPVACTIMFNNFHEYIAVPQSCIDNVVYLKLLLISRQKKGVKRAPINISMPLSGKLSRVTRLLLGLFLPMLSDINEEFLCDVSPYDLLVFCIQKVKATQKAWHWNYNDLKNAVLISERLLAPGVLTRAFANCCYDEKPHYFADIKRTRPDDYEMIVATENDFIQRTFFNKDLLVSMKDLPNIHSQTYWLSKDCSFCFNQKELRTLQGIEFFVTNQKALPSITPGKRFDFCGNFIQEVHPHLFDKISAEPNPIFKENTVWLGCNPLSETAQKLRRENR